MIRLRFGSTLAAAPDVVWRRATSVEGIDDEMSMRMTFPRGMQALPAGAGVALFFRRRHARLRRRFGVA